MLASSSGSHTILRRKGCEAGDGFDIFSSLFLQPTAVFPNTSNLRVSIFPTNVPYSLPYVRFFIFMKFSCL